MNMDPNTLSPWFTTSAEDLPPTNAAPTQHPLAYNDFHSIAPGASNDLSGTVGAATGFADDVDEMDEFATEPPLLEGTSTFCIENLCLFGRMRVQHESE